MNYIALIRKDAGLDYGVNFPDFPGCVTLARTLEQARVQAAEALDFHIAGMIEDGGTLPTPAGLDAIMADPHNADAAAFIVPVAAKREKAVRVNVTIQKNLLDRIDAFATDHGQTRAAFLAEAARARLGEDHRK